MLAKHVAAAVEVVEIRERIPTHSREVIIDNAQLIRVLANEKKAAVSGRVSEADRCAGLR